MDHLLISEVIEILGMELIFYPQIAVTPSLAMAWLVHFDKCSKQEFVTALHIAVAYKTSGFPPTPGEVNAVIKKLRATQESEETADIGWAAVMSNSPATERAYAAAELMNDWANRKCWETEHLHFRKREYERIYNTLKDQDEVLAIQKVARDELGYGREALPDSFKNLLPGVKWN